MKRTILIGAVLLSVLFLATGAILIASIERTSADLGNLLLLHQVEIVREQLLLSLKKTQLDLQIRNTTHASDINAVIDEVLLLNDTIQECFECHHVPAVLAELDVLRSDIGRYQEVLSSVFTMSANRERIVAEQDHAFLLGSRIADEISGINALAKRKLRAQTERALDDERRAKVVLYVILGGVPVLVLGLSFVLLRSILRPVGILTAAARRWEDGDLGHRVGALKDEFGKVAEAFDDMAWSLEANMREVQENERRYRQLFEHAADGILLLEAEGPDAGRIVSANPAAANMYRCTVDDLVGRHISDIYMHDQQAEMQVPDRYQRIHAGEWLQFESVHRRRDGALFPVEVVAGLFEDRGHRYILAFDRDITERKRAQDGLLAAQRMKMVGEMAAGIAHEVKNPLTGIKLSMEALLATSSSISAEDQAVLRQVRAQADRIEGLLGGILSFARPPKPELLPVDVNQVLRSVVSFFERGRSSLSVLLELDADRPEIVADAQQLQQVFMNLLQNAVDAMPAGGTIRVRSACDREQRKVSIEIDDEGPGISSDLVGSIFDPFVTTKATGVGLGLAVSRRLVELHGGVITAENRPEGGARFTVILRSGLPGSAVPRTEGS